MKKQNEIVRAAVFAIASAFAFSLSMPVYAADTKTAPAKTAVKQAAEPAKKPVKTLDEIFAFLPDPVAIVGTKKITKKDFMNQLGQVPVDYIAQLQPEMVKAQAQQMIKAMAEFEVLLTLAEQAGIKPSKDLIYADFDRQVKAMPKNQLDMIEKQLKLQNKTLKDIREDLVKQPNALKVAAVRKYVETKVKPGIKITDEEVNKFYRENPNQFKVPESVNASHILIMTSKPGEKLDAAAKVKKEAEAKAKAEKILAQLKQGADFGKLAAKESDCNSKAQQGNLGTFGRGQMVPEFEKAVFALSKPGQLSDIVKTQYGYHIIKLNSKTPASVVEFDKVKNPIRMKLESEKVQNAVLEQITQAQKTIKVTYPKFK